MIETSTIVINKDSQKELNLLKYGLNLDTLDAVIGMLLDYYKQKGVKNEHDTNIDEGSL